MNRERQQRFDSTGSKRRQVSRNGWLVAAILVIGSVLPVKALAQGGPSDRAGGVGERAAFGRRQVASQDAKLTLRIYNYAQVYPGVLASAEKITDAIFEESGVGITWMECTPVRGEFLPDPTCPSDMGASDLVLRLLPRRMAMKLAAPSEPLGFAQECPETEPACELTVFYFRVDELAADGHRPELILGHVMAHEMAHVLIGPGHSEDGIMRREWSREELRRMSLGLQLGFSAQQPRRLQEAVLRRMRVAVPETATRANSVPGQSKTGK